MAGRFPDDLSGGQQQRVAIARALVGGRRLILADEPTGALDTEAGDEVLRIIRARCDAGAAALVVTHNPRHAAWADRVLFLRDGVVVERTAYADAPADAPHPECCPPAPRRAGRARLDGTGHERTPGRRATGPSSPPCPPIADPRGPGGARRCAWPSGTPGAIGAAVRWSSRWWRCRSRWWSGLYLFGTSRTWGDLQLPRESLGTVAAGSAEPAGAEMGSRGRRTGRDALPDRWRLVPWPSLVADLEGPMGGMGSAVRLGTSPTRSWAVRST